MPFFKAVTHPENTNVAIRVDLIESIIEYPDGNWDIFTKTTVFKVTKETGRIIFNTINHLASAAIY